MDGFVSRLERLVGECREVGVVVGQVAGRVRGSWKGQAGTAWVEGLEEAQGLLGDTATVADSGVSVVRAYRGEVADIKVAERGWLDRKAEAGGMITALAGYSGDLVMESYRLARQAQFEQEVVEADAALRLLAERRDEADRQVEIVFRGSQGGSWQRTSALLAGAGISSVDDLTPQKLAEAYGPLVGQLAYREVDGSGVLNPAARLDVGDARALEGFLAGWSRDPAVMSAFFTRVGGNDVVSLVDRVGDEIVAQRFPDELGLSLAVLLRSGLAAGSRSWTRYQGQVFADGMFVHSHDSQTGGPSGGGDGRLAAVGFLFSDYHRPLGGGLAWAAATVVDRIEREQLFESSWGLIGDDPSAGARRLAELDGQVGSRRVDDVAGRVLDTLGAHPDAARDWLTDTRRDYDKAGGMGAGGMGAGRIEYWFGERDWAWTGPSSDAFEGPASLWRGAQLAEGGPTDPEASHGSLTRSSLMTSRIMTALAANPAFENKNVSDRAAGLIATAISVNLPMLAEIPITMVDDSKTRREPPTVVDVEVFGNPVESPGPLVADNDLAQIMGAAGAKPAGAVILRAAAQDYSTVLMGTAVQEHGMDVHLVAKRLAQVNAVIDGAAAGVKMQDAVEADAAAREGADGLGWVVKKVPVAGGPIGKEIFGRAVSAATGALGDQWAHNRETVLAEVLMTRDTGEQATRKAIEGYVRALQHSEDLPATIDPDDVVASALDDYGDEYDAAWLRASGQNQ